jgi:putative Holliday junction resolvase
VWFGVDVGTVRVGVARSDPRGVLAVPVATLRRDRRAGSDVDELLALGAEYEAVGYVIGLPRTLAGREGASVAMAREFGDALARRLAAPGVPMPLAAAPVEYLDERLTTVSAQRKLSGSGKRGSAGRAVIDQAAAVELLQHWLDTISARRPQTE